MRGQAVCASWDRATQKFADDYDCYFLGTLAEAFCSRTTVEPSRCLTSVGTVLTASSGVCPPEFLGLDLLRSGAAF